jgi:protein-S-isoprenylcysteine O-methyltransferase
MTHFIQHWIGTFWFGYVVVWVLIGLTAKRAVQRQSVGSRLLQSLLGALGLVCIFNFWGNIPQGWLTVRVIPHTDLWALTGAILSVAGVALAFWARAILGRNWSGSVTIKRDHQLILRGPYGFVRHPIYTGLLTGMFGTAIIFGLLRCFVGVLICMLSLWLKSQTEEKFMIQQFGDKYMQYRDRTRALVPFVL